MAPHSFRQVLRDTVERSTTRQRGAGKNARTVTIPRKTEDINRDYANLVTDRARALISRAFEAVPGLERVGISLYRSMSHPLRGHTYRGCILAVIADRPTWQAIIHRHVTAENALRNFQLNLRFDQSYAMQEVPPLHVPGTGSARIGTGYDLEPVEFERLVQRLLTAMGFTASLTKASHDGGVDIEANNPQPIVVAK